MRSLSRLALLHLHLLPSYSVRCLPNDGGQMNRLSTCPPAYFFKVYKEFEGMQARWKHPLLVRSGLSIRLLRKVEGRDPTLIGTRHAREHLGNNSDASARQDRIMFHIYLKIVVGRCPQVLQSPAATMHRQDPCHAPSILLHYLPVSMYSH